MDTMLQQFETPVTRNADTYIAYLYGRERADGTWEGRITFERTTDRARFTTPVETTQSNSQSILYWATGLTGPYFDGALERAQNTLPPRQAVAVPPPLVSPGADAITRDLQREDIERAVLGVFTAHGTAQLLTQVVFDSLPHSHADVVRALEHLEKQERRVIRKTEEGNDWLFLT
jgi:hypothetical protein